MDRVLISCERFSDLNATLALAEANGTGLDLQEFADPNILDGDWRGHVARYRKVLAGFRGELTLHGAFLDLFSGSPDRRVVAVARDRYRQNITIAAEVGAHLINFHANYLPLIDDPRYLPGWVDRQIGFWQPIAQEAGTLGITVVLENMWEPDPGILKKVIEGVHSPHLRVCLDVGHARVYSKLPIETWIATIQPYLVFTHLHNTSGSEDIHLAFDSGVLDMPAVLDLLRALPRPPIFCLELPDVASAQISLQYLRLDRHA